MSAPATTVAERLASVRAEIVTACHRVGRPPEDVTLVAVSKTHPASTVLEAVASGQLHFGENRVEEAAEKIPAVRAAIPHEASVPGITWHMIGHVQSRKARDVTGLFDLVHSLDSLKLAERYARFMAERFVTEPGDAARPLSVLLEINVSGEASKGGFAAAGWSENRAIREALWADVRQIAALPSLQIEGLMTMAPIVDDAEQARPVFSELRRLRDALAEAFPLLRLNRLSMGMSDDFRVAIEEGATLIRIGRAIFGPRD